jgi:hypothetical protein
VEFDECDELYGIGRLDWHQSDIRYTRHGCGHRERDLHAQLFRYRRNDIAIGDGDHCTAADGHAVRIAGKHRVRRRIDVDVEFDERDELYGVG